MNKHNLIRMIVAAGFAAVLVLPGCLVEGTPNAVRESPLLPPGAEAFQPTQPEAQPRRLTFLHTNDEHSHLFGFGPELDYPFLPMPGATPDEAAQNTTIAAVSKIVTDADQQTVGGFARRDYLINKLRTRSAAPVLTISAGDSTMGTLFHVAGTQAAPDWLAMALSGYDYMTLGNHEFDFGPDALALTIQAASNISFGGMPKIVSTNINFDEVQSGGSGTLLKNQFGDGGSGALIQPWDVKVMANGLRVGLLGAMGYHAAFVGPNRRPITFSVPQDGAACIEASSCVTDEPVMCASGLCQCTRGRCVDPLDPTAHILAAAADLQPYVDALRDELKVDLVVLISHMGTSEDVAVAQLTHGIDVIIGGHSHDILPAFVVPGTRTILAQTGSYGRALGELTVEVAANGAVSLAEAELHDVDYTLDAEIAAGTSLPTVVSPALERAVSLTLGVFAPVVGALNTELTTPLAMFGGVTSIYEPVATSDWGDIVGGLQFQDTNLLHFVTDAELAVVSANTCPEPASLATIAVQANGVLRDDLQFTQAAPHAVSTADVFRVVPLGASPFEAASVRAPGYPLMKFQLLAIELLPGLEVGVTNGLLSDDFFLSYAGAKIEYDLSRPDFMVTDLTNSGKITKITIGTDLGGYDWVIYDASRPLATRWQDAGGTPFDPTTNLITVITNLYIGGFLDAFGLAPRNGVGATIGLDDTILCWTGMANDCGGTGASAIMSCKTASAGTVPWPVPEVKEWQVLLSYLTTGLGGALPPLYVGPTPAAPRVIDVTP